MNISLPMQFYKHRIVIIRGPTKQELNVEEWYVGGTGAPI
jgi:hypothetical protein